MTDNNKPKDILRVEIDDGKMSVHFGKFNMSLIGHALRLANLQLDNEIIKSQAKPSPIAIPDSVKRILRR